MSIALLFEPGSPALPAVPLGDQIAYGPPGIEAKHIVTPGFVVNDVADWPMAILDRITGIHSRADADDPRDPAVGRIGEVPHPTVLKGKTLTFEGEVRGKTLPELRTGAADLRSRASGVLADRVNTILPDLANESMCQWFYFGRVVQYEQGDEQKSPPWEMPTAWKRPFVLALRMSDPRFFASHLFSADAAYDVGLAEAFINLAYNGPAPTEPRIRITGPADSIVLSGFMSDYPTGRSLRLPGLYLPAGQTVTFDFAARTVIRTSDGKDLSGMLTDDSDWWGERVYGLPVDGGVVQLTGTGMTAATHLHVDWYAASF